MIAGPATITAVVTMPAVYGRWMTIAAVVTALLLNWVIMRNAGRIGKILVKFNMMMPLIRIIALIVAAIGLQMILSGIEQYVLQIHGSAVASLAAGAVPPIN